MADGGRSAQASACANRPLAPEGFIQNMLPPLPHTKREVKRQNPEKPVRIFDRKPFGSVMSHALKVRLTLGAPRGHRPVYSSLSGCPISREGSASGFGTSLSIHGPLYWAM